MESSLLANLADYNIESCSFLLKHEVNKEDADNIGGFKTEWRTNVIEVRKCIYLE